MKIGVNIKVDVTKLDKARFFKGQKGTYVDLTAFIDTDVTGQYGDNGTVTQKGEKGEKLPIIGNVKVFWKDGGSYQHPGGFQGNVPPPAQADDMDVPF